MGRDSRSPESSRFVFPKWTNSLRGYSVLLAGGGLVYVVALLTYVFSPESSAIGYEPDQPVPYSHALHVGQMGIDCRYCHDKVELGAPATIPSAATCMNCHASVKTESEKLALVRAAYENDLPLRWVRIHDLPDFVYFDHSAHLGAGVGCIECHGRVDRMEVVSQDKRLSMGWCLECHREPETRLRPREFVTDMQWQPEEDAFAQGARLMEEHDITPSEDCSTCHR